MKLTTRGRYALQALIDLITNSHGKAVKLMDISGRQDLPIAYLEQLFRQLRIASVVKSVRGPGGGYVLAKDPSQITVQEVFSAVEEVTSYVKVLGEPPAGSPDALIRAHDLIVHLDVAASEVLATPLSDLTSDLE